MRELILNGSQIKSIIYIGRGSIDQTADLCFSDKIQQLNDMPLTDLSLKDMSYEEMPSKVCIITDKNVEPLYLNQLISSFQKFNLPIVKHSMEPGEGYKTLKTVEEIYETLSKEGFGRNDMIIALGGGVVGDIAGFAAATFLRGMKHLIQIPTTLLAQVDSSVGGKCGVDLPRGKNLVGAFRQPNKVIVDLNLLDTLSKEIYASGIAEIIKYGCIWDPSILDLIRTKHSKDNMEEIVTKCIKIKIQVVQEDETENGLRKILNFGHTIGHSIERLGNFTEYSHGEAIAIGMAAAVKMGEHVGITKQGCYDYLLELLKLYNLPLKIHYPIEAVHQAMLSDKKKQGDRISFIYIEDFGKVKIVDYSLNQLKDVMKVLSEE